MGAGGLNGELRDQSEHVNSLFRYHFDLQSEGGANRTAQSTYYTSPSNSRSQAFISSTSAGNSSCLDSTEMVCYLCSVNFTLFKRKNICRGCKKTLCLNCFTQGMNTRENVSHCITCRALGAPIIYKEFLKKLKIKDLQDYLRSRNVPTHHCKEKQDLVELILQYTQARFQPQAASGTSSNQSSRHSGQVAQPRVNPYAGLFNGVTTNTASSSNRSNSRPEGEKNSSEATKRTIDDLTNIEQISNLSVRELKQILTANFVDFKGCVEKEELLEKVRCVWISKNETKQKGENDLEDMEEMCKVCMDQSIDCVLLECGHMVACISCSKQLTECPICRQNITRIVRVFKA